MRILLINIAHPAIGSRIPKEQLPPLGLLSIGGPLIDAGFTVQLIDAERGPMTDTEVLRRAVEFAPDAVLFGHSGSSSGHPIIAHMARTVRAQIPKATIVYGGVHPSYFWREILTNEPYVDYVVRGEGDAICLRLMQALATNGSVDDIAGLSFRRGGDIIGNPAAPVITDLDAWRIGWELIAHENYGYWGGKRAVVVQFSRGCPHPCNYCGQRGFWTRWRHRDPVKFAAEIARLHREHGVEVFNFADENPSAGRKPWIAFLQAMIAENIDVTLVGSTRAGDIVRDADVLHLYKKAGFERFLMGMETTDATTLKLIRKGATESTDRQAIQLMRRHEILSMMTWVAGFDEQTDADFWTGLQQIVSYDPDQVQLLYVTPHRWTPYYRLAEDREVVQTDLTRWDYKHQILRMSKMPPWRVLLWMKFIEVVAQARPKALMRLLWHPDRKIHHAIKWYYQMGRRVWFHELYQFFFKARPKASGLRVRDVMGAPQDHEEEASSALRKRT